ncbi:MAG: MgtC/SapB family protein [Armatimonadota bacterium]
MMHNLTLWDMTFRLIISLLLGAMIGMERETHGRPAGLRTHILVCFGSTLFTLASYQIAGKMYDPARVTAQIVTGVGFLGAGTIIHQGSVIRGLTTAASIWTVAAIGVAAGIGGDMLYLAAIASLLAFVVLSLIAPLEKLLTSHKDERTLTILTSHAQEDISDILSILSKHGIRVRMLNREDDTDGGGFMIAFKLRAPAAFDEIAFDSDLANVKNIVNYRWD